MITLYHGSNVSIDRIDLSRSGKGKDFSQVTMKRDMQIMIEFLAADLAEMLMDEYGWDMLKALDELYHSKTFEKVNNPRCGLYYQGPVYVFDFLKKEIETGKIA